MPKTAKKTILVIANFASTLYDFRAELLIELLKEYHVVCAVPDHIKEKEILALGCEFAFTPMNRRGMNPFEDYGLFRNYRRLIKEKEPVLVLLFTVKPNIYGGLACRLARVPYLASVTGLGSSFEKRGFLKWLVVILYRAALKRAACVFFQNSENKGIFDQYRISGKKSRLVSGSGVNIKNFAMEPYPPDEWFCFLFVGRVMREKGIEEFLAAAEALHSESVRFQILGFCEEQYQSRLDQLEVRGVIEQLGFLPDIKKYYAAASAVVLPSYHEGLSNALMEASAIGRPVFASDIAGCREVFDDGETGFGFAKGDSDGLIRALKKFMAIPLNERALMGRKAREKMGREFNREKVVAEYMEEINEVRMKNAQSAK